MKPSNAAARRPAGPVRQHSLQQPLASRRSASQAGPVPIRRQRSTEDERQQRARVRFAAGVKAAEPVRQPRPAWADGSESGVELVARQIAAVRTPVPGPRSRAALPDKPAILYSRQELAERLRLAWRQREANKSNIDIFLAHGALGERCESRLSTPPGSLLPTPRPRGDVIGAGDREEEEEEEEEDEEEQEKGKEPATEVREPSESRFQAWLPAVELATSSRASDVQAGFADDFGSTRSDENEEKAEEEEEQNDEGGNGDGTQSEEEEEEEPVRDERSFISIDCREYSASGASERAEAAGPDYSQAWLKRASYRSGLNKAFQTPVVEKPSTPPPALSRASSRASSLGTGCGQEPGARFRRTSSAPPQRRDGRPASSRATTAPEEPQPEQARQPGPRSRPVKSAPPAKRRTRLAAGSRRRGPRDEEPRRPGAQELPRSADVVTMVSLVSSADSESEMDENSPRDDKLICELRSKLPTTPIIKSANGLAGGFRKPFKSVSFQHDSFERDSPRPECRAPVRGPSRSGVAEDGPPSGWRLEAGPSLREPSPRPRRPAEGTTTASSKPEAPTDREKRCLAVPIGDDDDARDKKRKLLRCRSALVVAPRVSEPEKRQSSSEPSQTCLRTDTRMSQTGPRAPGAALQENAITEVVTNPMMPTIEAPPEKDKDLPKEPYGQTPKEKECWHLYRRMCDKGVFVSFDTVLRGMLTPTEYRLRQKEVSQNC